MAEKINLLQLVLEAAEEEKQLSPKQKNILIAAIALFAEKGYAATSTSEIAKLANVAEGTVFRHYKTKKELLQAITTPAILGKIVPPVAEEFKSEVLIQAYPSFASFLREIIKNRFAFVDENSQIIKIFAMELFYQEDLRERFIGIFSTRVKPTLVKIIQHYKAQEELVDLPDDTILRAILTNVIGFLLTRFFLAPNISWEDEVEVENTILYITKGIVKK